MHKTALMGIVLVLVVCVVAAAEDKPWEKPGTAAGQEIVGPDGGAMVWVPGGEFLMGSTAEQIRGLEKEWPQNVQDLAKFVLGAETPQHRVHVDGFWLGKYEVTNAQYLRFVEATGREFPSGSDQGDNHPVVSVTWYDAKAYCDHHRLKLPTEAQWEYAARGSDNRIFPWGNEWDGSRLCWCSRETLGPGSRTFPVGSFPQGASWCEAVDMAGNVSEWCMDWYDPNYYKGAPTSSPPGPFEAVTFWCPFQGEVVAVTGVRVLRGSSFGSYSPCTFRCPYRDFHIPSRRGEEIGFRCCRTP